MGALFSSHSPREETRSNALVPGPRLNGAGASLEGWIDVLAAASSTVIHKMRWPTIQGWVSIVGVFLNALGVWLLFYFRLEAVGGWVSEQSINETNARQPEAHARSWALIWSALVWRRATGRRSTLPRRFTLTHTVCPCPDRRDLSANSGPAHFLCIQPGRGFANPKVER
jgi:hypothetical protein